MKEENVLKYYLLCNRLKTLLRKGWLDWKINEARIETVAEHIYSTQMLALAMYTEYKYDIDIVKVILMLSIHETEEIIIGDLTLFDISKEEKDIIGHKAVKEVFSCLSEDTTFLEDLINEFDERKTPEAKFAYQVDKLECDLQAKTYSDFNDKIVNFNDPDVQKFVGKPEVKECIDSGMSFGEIWMEFGERRYPYDENFMSVSNYAKNTDLKKLVRKDNNENKI